MTGPVLFTKRLILRPQQPEDFEGWAAFQADEETARFVGGAQPRSAAWRSFCAMAGAWAMRGFAMFSMIERDTGRWIGRTGPWQPEGWPGTEVGWGVLPEYAGRGFAHEAAVASIDYAVDVLGWTDIIHLIDPENLPSIRLAERLGAVQRGPARMPAPFEHIDAYAWGQTATEWKGRRAQARRAG